MRWPDINSDPNSKAARDWRRQRLDAAWQPAVKDRRQYLASLCRGRLVLDVGCVDHFLDGKLIPDGLYREITKASKSCTGLDINEAGVRQLQDAGYQAVVADITAGDFAVPPPGGFETVIAGEVIEHVTNLETFFTNLKNCLRPNGLLVMTSPNPYSLSYLLSALKYRQFESVDHVTYVFPSGMAEMADRFGLSLASWRGVESFVSPRSLPQWILQKLACANYQNCVIHCNQLIYEFRRDENGAPKQ